MKRLIIFTLALGMFMVKGCLNSNDELVPMQFYASTDTIPIRADVLLYDGMGTYKTYTISRAKEFNGNIMVLDDDYDFVEPSISVRIKTNVDSIAELYRDTLTVYLSISINGRLLGERYFDQNSEDSLLHIQQQNGGVNADDWNWYDFSVVYEKKNE